MIRVLVVSAAALALSACGASICSRDAAEQTRILDGKASCAYTEGAVTITISKTGSESTCESNISKCNSADQALVEEWITCLKAVPVCSTGAEKAAVDGYLACAVKLVDTSTSMSKLSADCQAAFK